MKRRCVAVVGLLSILLCPSQLTVAQTASALPHLVRFSGTVKDLNGNPMTGMVGITFALYSDQTGGAPLWLETQNVAADSTGHYTVLLGSTSSQGLPESIFASEQAHWVGVQVQGQAEQPRVLLVSAPYALKAGDAETVGGLPPSAFVLAPPSGKSSGESPIISATTNVGGSGTTDYIPLWTSGFILGNSVLFQSGSGSTAMVGINTAAPAATLDVNGIINAATSFNLGNNLFATGSYAAGNALLGYAGNSKSGAAGFSNTGSGYQALFNNISSYNAAHGAGALFSNTTGSFNTASGYNALKNNTTGSTNTAVGYQALVTNSTGGNNTALGYQAGPNTSGLSYATAIGANATVTESNAMVLGGTGAAAVNVGIGTAAPAYPLDVAGIIRTSSGGVKFPDGTVQTTAASGGGGTITGVTAGTDLTGGGTSGNVTLNLDTTKVPQLASANTFTASQTVNGNITASGQVQGGVVNATTSFDIGGIPFAFGSFSNGNAFLGFAGNSTTTGKDNTASGYQALLSNTTGNNNTATGQGALSLNSSGSVNTANGLGALAFNTTGSFNTASGQQALYYNKTASYNTAAGYYAGQTVDHSYFTGANNTAVGSNTAFSTGSLTNATAIGSNAEVSASNALVLGCISGVNSCPASVNVGIGTTTPGFALDVKGVVNTSTSFNMGGTAFAFGSASSGNAFLGFAGNSIGGGFVNTASGSTALYNNITGNSNTASGSTALYNNTTGSFNTASGVSALYLNTTGSYNSALGAGAGPDKNSPNLTNATAIGANAIVSESNAVVLGGTGQFAVNVGIGTPTPAYTLDVHGSGNFTGGVTFASSQMFPGVAELAAANTFTADQTVNTNMNVVGDTRVDALGLNGGTNSPGLRFGAGSTGEAIASDRTGTVNQNGIDLYTNFTPRLSITNAGNVGIGTPTPNATLAVNGNFSVGGDLPMSNNPRMVWSGFLSGSLYACNPSCYPAITGGYFTPDRAIVITRIQAGEAIQGSNDVGCLIIGNPPNNEYNFTLYPNVNWDSGPIYVPFAAGTPLQIAGTAINGVNGCYSPQGYNAAANVFVNVQYVMQ